MFTLYFYHDPMCSWCWGYRPTAQALFSSLPENVSMKNVLGGLAPDSDEPMSAELRSTISGHWKRIHDTLGTEFNFDFWTNCKPRRSTYPACRAVIAATNQDREEDMIFAIQRAYYLRAMNPSDLETLEALADELDLNRALFQSDLRSWVGLRLIATSLCQQNFVALSPAIGNEFTTRLAPNSISTSGRTANLVARLIRRAGP